MSGDIIEAEAEAWQRGLAGDGRAFGQIFDLHRARVFRYAYRLLVTTGNTVRNLRRSQNRYRTLIAHLPHGDHQASAEHESFADEIIDDRLWEALRGLSVRDMSLVTLVMVEGYAPSEAALLLGLSPGSVRTRLHRIRVTLRAHMSASPFDPDLSELGLS